MTIPDNARAVRDEDAFDVARQLIEGALTNAFRGYVDSRGWGRLPDGTLLHFPIPARELAALNMAVYSFGGVGGPAAAECTQPFCD